MKRRCMKCEHVYLDSYGIPVSCDYGLPKDSGASRIGEYCHKTGKKLYPIKTKNGGEWLRR